MVYRLDRPLVCYRIADARFPLFSGERAAELGGRWNPRGRPAIYACTTYSGAMLEMLAQLGTTRIPHHQASITVTIPTGLTVQECEPDELLEGWNASDYEIAQTIGEKWLNANRAVALIVPSVVFPIERNVVLNPLHSEASKIAVGEPVQVKWDERLFTARKRRPKLS